MPINANLRGDVLAISNTLTASDSYGQINPTWTFASGIPSGFDETNDVMNAPNVPPSRYMGLWAALETNNTERDVVLMPWGNARITDAPTEGGGDHYFIITDLTNDRVVGLNDAGTAAQTSRGFNLISANSDPRGLTFGDGLIWVLDNTGNTLYPYQLDGTQVSARNISFTAQTTGEFACAYYNGNIYIAAFGSAALIAHNATTGANVLNLSNVALTQSVGMAISNTGIMWLARASGYSTRQVTATDVTVLNSFTSFPNNGNTGASGMVTDGSNVYVYDQTDNGYYTYPITDSANGTLGNGTLTSLGNLGSEQGLSMAMIAGTGTLDLFTLSADDESYPLSMGDDRVDIHYLRQPDGNIRIVPASSTDLLPSNAVIKIYPAAI